jgi:uncharacterized membrane protein
MSTLRGSAWWPAALALFASVTGLVFASLSTYDYAQHLDRQIHDVHCSFIPGMPPEKAAESACKVAMYSPYAALLRDRYWGGVPIALFAVGAYAFFAAFAAYALLAGDARPRRAAQFLATVGLTPLAASAVMFFLSATRLGQFCKTCVGMYGASVLLAAAGLAAVAMDRREARLALAARRSEPARAGAGGAVPAAIVDAALDTSEPPRAAGGLSLVPAWLVALGLCTATPALVYASALPSYAGYVNACGKLEAPKDATGTLLRITPAGATQPATMFVDPLCPTCKALHQRLVAEGIYDQLDTTLVLFPLDNECNWMLDRAVHPGSCMVSKAILCGDAKARSVLEWTYDNQERLLELAKGGDMAGARAMVKARWPEVDACIDAKETSQRLTKMLRHIVKNHLPVSTPQIYIGETRLCDEDTDMGLPYAMRKLAPALVAR